MGYYTSVTGEITIDPPLAVRWVLVAVVVVVVETVAVWAILRWTP
jgi:hypothetical protein